MTDAFVAGGTEQTMFELRPPAWQSRANCLPDRIPAAWWEHVAQPVDLFFPVGSGVITNAWKAQIALCCDNCPVRAECLDHGLKHEEEGWWGGVSPTTLERMRKEQRIPLRTPEIDQRTRKVIGTAIEPSHGTFARWRRHKQDGEEPCPACKDARGEYYYEARRAAYAEWKSNATPEEREAKRLANKERASRRHKGDGSGWSNTRRGRF